MQETIGKDPKKIMSFLLDLYKLRNNTDAMSSNIYGIMYLTQEQVEVAAKAYKAAYDNAKENDKANIQQEYDGIRNMLSIHCNCDLFTELPEIQNQVGEKNVSSW